MGSIIVTGGAATYPPQSTTAAYGILKLATNAQALAGTDNTTAMTPLDAANALAAQIGVTVAAHNTNLAKLNVAQGYTKQQFTIPVSGVVSGTVTLDCDDNPDTYYATTGTITFADPTHIALGKTMNINVFSATTARSVLFGTKWTRSGDISLITSTIPDVWTFLQFRCLDGVNMTLVGYATSA